MNRDAALESAVRIAAQESHFGETKTSGEINATSFSAELIVDEVAVQDFFNWQKGMSYENELQPVGGIFFLLMFISMTQQIIVFFQRLLLILNL